MLMPNQDKIIPGRDSEKRSNVPSLDILLEKMENAELTCAQALELAYVLGATDLKERCLAKKRKVSDKERTYYPAVGTRVIENELRAVEALAKGLEIPDSDPDKDE